ncbi:MAG: type I-E CRISPR-associated protein Cas5/CasD [Aristaeellaceae bacterium]
MSTLLLRLAGPMQAWGAQAQFEIRKTNREPTKSGVIGLLAAALGLRRDAPLTELAQLRFGVRVDREGVLLRDFHMARGKKDSYVTTRYYLCDAVFLVGVSSEDEALMQHLAEAVTCPAFPLFLGRRSCPPEGRVCLGLRPLPLEEALRHEPPLVQPGRNQPDKVRMLLDAPDGLAKVRDVPVSFSPYHRQYAYRAAKEVWQDLPANEHDPMQELR